MTNSIVKFTKNISNIFVRLTHAHTNEASGFNFNIMAIWFRYKSQRKINKSKSKAKEKMNSKNIWKLYCFWVEFPSEKRTMVQPRKKSIILSHFNSISSIAENPTPIQSHPNFNICTHSTGFHCVSCQSYDSWEITKYIARKKTSNKYGWLQS